MSPFLIRTLVLALGACLIGPITPPADAAPRRAASAPKVDKATRLNRLYAEYWEALMRLDPLQATLQGDARYNDQLPNTLSPAFRESYRTFNQQWLDKVEAVGADGLTGQDLLSYQLFVRDTRAALASQQHPSWMLPINAYYSPATLVAMLGSGASAQPFESVTDYSAWARRAAGVPALFEQAISNMRQGMAAGVTQPQALMQAVLPQLDAILATGQPEDTLFWGPIRHLPAHVSPADATRLTDEYRQLIANRLLPAYRSLRSFIANEYLPACRTTDGLGALPNGREWYAHNLYQATTLTRDPGDIHTLGVAEVERLQAEMAQTIKANKLRGKRDRVMQRLHSDSSQRFASADALLDAYRQTHQRLAPLLAPLMPDVPLAPLDIQPLPAERSATASAVSYQPPGLPNASATLWINTQDLARRTRWQVTMQYLHEGLPGHHLQLGQARSATSLPRFRQNNGDTAFVEGWGLYAESLGQELGLYQSPNETLGWLHTHLLRTARIVADTGLHAQGWNRKKAAAYLVEQADVDPDDAAREVERMMAMPGQALAARVGELRLQRLRENAQQSLGVHFDLRAFHAEVLRDGSLPLDVMEAKIQRWIDANAG